MILIALFFTLGLLFTLVLIHGFAPYQTDLAAAFSPSTSGHWLGTDQLGRDYLSRLLLGSLITLIFAAMIQAVAVAIGSLTGVFSGFFESGWFDKTINESMIILFTIPSILFILTITAVIGKSTFSVLFSISIILWVKSSSVIRGRVILIRNRDYILAAQVLGLKMHYILGKYIFSEIAKDISFIYLVGLLDAILIETGLSLLGLGVQPPTPSLGAMLRDGMHNLGMHVRFVLWPGMILIVITLCLTLLVQKKGKLFSA